MAAKHYYRIPPVPYRGTAPTYIGETFYIFDKSGFSGEIRVEVVGKFGTKILARSIDRAMDPEHHNQLVELVGYHLVD